MKNEVNELLHKRGQIVDQMQSMLAKADAEKRDLTEEENSVFNKMDTEQSSLKDKADRLHKMENLKRDVEGVVDDAHHFKLNGSDAKSIFASEEYRNGFDQFARIGKNGLSGQILAALQVGTDSEGGFIVPTEFDTMLVEALQDMNDFRNHINVITTGSDRNLPIESSLGSATWTAEEAAYTESDAAFGQVVLGSHKLGTIVKVSEELLQDAFFDVEGYLARNFGKRFGLAEETAIVNGDGSGKPTGLVQGASAGVTAASNAAITSDELLDLFHSLARPYRKMAKWTMNDSTVKAARKLKDSNNQYIWQPGLQAGQPDTLLGREVIASSDMPAIATTAVSVLFGDLSYYTLAERGGRNVQRLNELYAANGQVGFRGWERLDGKLTLSAAVKKLTHPV